jgi:hypothetical protein
VVIGDSDTRVSAIRGKDIDFVTKLIPLELPTVEVQTTTTEGTLFDK